MNHSRDSSLQPVTLKPESYFSNYLNNSGELFLHSIIHFPSGRKEEITGSLMVA